MVARFSLAQSGGGGSGRVGGWGSGPVSGGGYIPKCGQTHTECYRFLSRQRHLDGPLSDHQQNERPPRSVSPAQGRTARETPPPT